MPAPQIGRAAASRSLQRDVIVVAWQLPAEAVAALLPHGLKPATIPDCPESPTALIVLWSSLRTSARWAPLPESWGETYRHAELRVPVFWEDSLAHVVLRSYISHAGLAQALFPISATTAEGRFDVVIDGNPATETIDSATVAVTTETPRIRLRVQHTDDTSMLDNPDGALSLIDNPDTQIHFPRIGRKNAVVHQVAFDAPQWQILTVTDASLSDLPAPWNRPTQPVSARYAASIDTRTWPGRGVVARSIPKPANPQTDPSPPAES